MDRQSDLGRKIGGYMSRGELVPDELTVELWQQYVQGWIREQKFIPARDLLVLDGIPRSRRQAELIAPHVNVLRIIHLACPKIDDMVNRMKRRALKENRPDDADEAVIRRRFDVYAAETRPVLAYYGADVISEVNAIGSPAEVLLNVLQTVVPIYNKFCGNPLAA